MVISSLCTYSEYSTCSKQNTIIIVLSLKLDVKMSSPNVLKLSLSIIIVYFVTLPKICIHVHN